MKEKKKKKKHWFLRIIWASVFLLLAAFVMLYMYKMSNENETDSSIRSETVTETLKQEIKEHMETSWEGYTLEQKIKSYIILYSPYGSDWNLNVRKFAHFMIYFSMAIAIYITLAILGVGKFTRFFLTLFVCAAFACGDEWHQGSVDGRTMSIIDVCIDSCGALLSTTILTILSIIYSIFYKIFH